jgi:PIN domain nuclease of toxin-antitoxin system
VILLDTHVWLWTVTGETRRIGRRTRQLVGREERRGAVRISPASVFEVAALHTLGRLRLAMPVESWLRDALEQAGLRLAPLSVDVAIDAGLIPREALADPFDRLLVAGARQGGATLITADERIINYATETSAVRVHDART